MKKWDVKKTKFVLVFIAALCQTVIFVGVVENKPKELIYAIITLIFIGEIKNYIVNNFIVDPDEVDSQKNSRRAKAEPKSEVKNDN